MISEFQTQMICIIFFCEQASGNIQLNPTSQSHVISSCRLGTLCFAFSVWLNSPGTCAVGEESKSSGCPRLELRLGNNGNNGKQAEGLKELVVALKAHQAIDFIFKFEYVLNLTIIRLLDYLTAHNKITAPDQMSQSGGQDLAWDLGNGHSGSFGRSLSPPTFRRPLHSPMPGYSVLGQAYLESCAKWIQVAISEDCCACLRRCVP